MLEPKSQFDRQAIRRVVKMIDEAIAERHILIFNLENKLQQLDQELESLKMQQFVEEWQST